MDTDVDQTNVCQESCIKHCFASDTSNIVYYIALLILAVMIFFIGYNVGSRRTYVKNRKLIKRPYRS